jgi:hypothetical protein
MPGPSQPQPFGDRQRKRPRFERSDGIIVRAYREFPAVSFDDERQQDAVLNVGLRPAGTCFQTAQVCGLLAGF